MAVKKAVCIGDLVEYFTVFESIIATSYFKSVDYMLAHFTIRTDKPFDLASFPKNKKLRLFLDVPGNALGVSWQVPLVVFRGTEEGPVLGITSAIHGNELNGIFSIFKVMKHIKTKDLKGTVIFCPIVNIPGFLFQKRKFPDGQDLNRIMPGELKADAPSKIYNHYLTSKVISQFNYLLDLHTASAGKANSLYVRADLSDPDCKRLAYYQNPQIIVQKYDAEGTLRSWANSRNIPAITIEIGNPDSFQSKITDETVEGILNTLTGLDMLHGRVKDYMKDTSICSSSHWMYAPTGGLLEVIPKLTEMVKKGQQLAVIYNMFGQVISTIKSEHDAIVIGKATTPYCEAGSRVIHLGLMEKTSQ